MTQRASPLYYSKTSIVHCFPQVSSYRQPPSILYDHSRLFFAVSTTTFYTDKEHLSSRVSSYFLD